MAAAILLVHGFTGAPSDLKTVGLQLEQEGYIVRSVLLAGHEASPEAMAKTTRHDWYLSVEKAFLDLEQEGHQVFVVGHSMGGLLALELAHKHSLAGVVTICSPIFLRNWLIYLAPVLKYFIAFVPKGDDPDLEPLLESHFTYNRVATRCVADLLKLIGEIKEMLPNIRTPIAVLQSEADLTVKPKSANYIYDNIGSQAKELIFIPRAGHLVTLQAQRTEVIAAIKEFISKRGK